MFYKIAMSIIKLMSVVLLVYQGFVYPFLKWQGRDFPEKIRNPIQGRKKNFKEWFEYVYVPVGTNLFGYAKILSDIFFDLSRRCGGWIFEHSL